MKKIIKTKKNIILAMIIIVITVIIIIFSKNAKENSTKISYENTLIDTNNLENAEMQNDLKVNISAKAHEEKTYKDFKFNNLTIDSKNGETNLNVEITNTGKEETKEQYVKLICERNDKTEIGQLYLLISALKPSQTITANATVEYDYINLYDYIIENIEK